MIGGIGHPRAGQSGLSALPSMSRYRWKNLYVVNSTQPRFYLLGLLPILCGHTPTRPVFRPFQDAGRTIISFNPVGHG